MRKFVRSRRYKNPIITTKHVAKWWKWYTYLLMISIIMISAMSYYPINNIITRIVLLTAIFVIIMILFVMFYRYKFFFLLYLYIVSFLFFFIVLGTKTTIWENFNEDYIQNLLTYNDVNYVLWWEWLFGMDCSWLVRHAMVISLIKEWIRNYNWYDIMKWFKLWWSDFDVDAMLSNEYNRFIDIWVADSINKINHEFIKPWDLAIIDWVHVMAYVWGRQWIQADPEIWKVIVLKTPTSNKWFNLSVKIIRWNDLDYKEPEKWFFNLF